MTCFQSRGYTGAWVPAGIHDVLSIMIFGFIEQCLDSWLCKTPSACVQWLLLTPDDCLCVRIAVKVLLELSPWERIQLFDTSDGSILKIVEVVCPMLVQSYVHLTRAEDNTVNLLRWSNGLPVLRIWNNPLEV